MDLVGPVLTDPPYGVDYEYESWDDMDAKANDALFERLFKLSGPLVCFCGTINLLREMLRGGGERKYGACSKDCKVAIWHKPWSMTHSGIGNGRHHWEPIIIRRLGTGAYLPTNVISQSTDRIPGLRDAHSCPKPVALFAHLISCLLPEGDICDECHVAKS